MGIGGHPSSSRPVYLNPAKARGFSDSPHVSGASAHGIFAQSTAGGEDGVAGDVRINVHSNVVASGDKGRAILAQSKASSDENSGHVRIVVDNGATVATRGADSDTIAIKGGKENEIINNGTMVNNGDRGYVIRTDGEARLTVENSGDIFGSIENTASAGWPINFVNEHEGWYTAGPEISLGGDQDVEKGILYNEGVIEIGARRSIQATDLKGNFTQQDNGIMLIDVNADQAQDQQIDVDRLSIDGDAELAGEISVRLDVGDNPKHGPQVTQPFIQATSMTDSGLTVESSVAATYSLNWDTPNEVRLEYDLDFSSATARSAARSGHVPLTMHLQDMYEAGSLSREEANVLVRIEDPDTYRDAIASLSGEVYALNQYSSLQGSLRLGDTLMSCAEDTGAYRFISEGQCGWLMIGQSQFLQRESRNRMGVEETTFSLAGGIQVGASNGWSFGTAFSYEDRELTADGMMSSEGDVFQLGGVAKRQFGPALFAASLAVGHGKFDIERNSFLGDRAKGSQDIWTVSGQVRGEYLMERGNWYAKPRLDLGVDVVLADDIRESGAAGFNHNIDDSSDTYFNLQPAVEFGGEWKSEGGTVYRPSMTLGMTKYFGNGAPDIHSLFDSSHDGASRFRVSTEFDKTYADVGLGLKVLAKNGLMVDAGAFGSLSESSEKYGANLRLSYEF
ncbi:autotransporter outer membrane beta-barrel domain-containing protein [Salipiger mucosus]|uniref:Autotransporter domain-containing protein n=1 Tax=Salipiger mucosus DSM 16094 TaxID=1123237 RepID=S9Q7P5_9RHOB|nr:autotransporter outer membrane beta-barrel domain-containing protein [Salipiger mucosus]EPX75598.1 hypothetical protein Salmuc_00086 [Salipiger mucosus DSM 16094]